jgi:hypothetical protein
LNQAATVTSAASAHRIVDSVKALKIILIWLTLAGAPGSSALWAQGDSEVLLTPEDHAYHIYPIHHGQCPDGVDIRCHKYHWHWVCRRGDVLYWDRRLLSAAHAACGLPSPEGVEPASPAVSGPPIEELIDADGRRPVDLDRLRSGDEASSE